MNKEDITNLKTKIMNKEDITKSFHFGVKVKFLKQDKIHPDLRDKEFCLIGFNDNAFVVIEWDKRGGCGFGCCVGSVYSELELVASESYA